MRFSTLVEGLVFLGVVSLGRSNGKSLLSFGGNGNIGSEVLYQVLETGEFEEIFVVFRSGEWHFDSGERIAPKVKYLPCDRSRDPPCAAEPDCDINSLKLCPELMEVIESETFDLVLDFTAYEPKWVRDVLEIVSLKEKKGLYLYISTDSVYEVSKPKTQRRPSVETDAVRPEDFEVRDRFKKADMYGHSKLAGEEVLKEQNKVHWVALRLADVIGPRDTSRRLWLYIIWIKFFSVIQEPLYLPPEVKGVDESLTYVKDVGRVVKTVLEMGPSVWNEAYNIALKDTFSLEDILTRTADTMNVSSSSLEFYTEDSEKSFHLFPTVFRGSMSLDKAREKLGFVPTDVNIAFSDAIDWSIETFIENENEREEMTSRLMTYVVSNTGNSKAFLTAVDEFLAKKGVWTRRYQNSKRGDTGDLHSKTDKTDKTEL